MYQLDESRLLPCVFLSRQWLDLLLGFRNGRDRKTPCVMDAGSFPSIGGAINALVWLYAYRMTRTYVRNLDLEQP
jgi:hypothetical protein